MELENKLEQNNIDEQVILEEIIVPEHCLTLEKINKQITKKDETKTKHKTKQSKCDDDDDDALYADDDSQHKQDDDECDDDVKKSSKHDEYDQEDDDVVELEAVCDTADAKTVRPSNSFAASKNVAQGMMDIALITANANQLRYILAYTKGTSTERPNISLTRRNPFFKRANKIRH
ncbi:hypothetical protein RN001_015244 [Aquatica leii]|uniref:Uncharacterized protein n=1 Tax=Aquatica leii TaxID=1421715 RepID=A0AAN7PZ65_9COLE|nr:hypothetical protein RN001_015244 [Aquatica leii]